MKLEINGKVVEVDDSFANLPPEQQQAIVNEIAAQMSPKEKEGTTNALYGIGAGAIAGPVIGRPIAAFTEGMQKPKAPAAPTPAPSAPSAEVPAKGGAVENWARTQHSGEFYGGKDYAGAHQRAMNVKEGLAETPGYKAAQGSGLMAPREAMEDFEARKAAKEALAKRSQMTFGEKFTEKYPGTSRVGAGAANVLRKGAPPFVGRAGAGAMAGYQGVDAYNRAKQGDILGAGISGLGSAGAVASMAPNPKVRAVGALTSVLGEAINRMRNPDIDPTEVRMPNVISPATAGVNNPMAAGGVVGYAKGKAVKALKELNPFDLTKLEGKTILGTMSDRTAVDLARNLYGGPMFPRIHEGAAWGVDSPGAASRLLNAMNEAGGPKNVVVSPMLMSPGAHKSNRDVSKIALREFQKNFQEGKFGPERLAEIEISARKIPGLESLGGLTEAEALDALNRMTFKQRGDLVERLGSKPKTAPALDLSKVLRETTEPGIEGAELGAIGPSIFTLSGHKSVNPALHGSYSQILHGDLLGEMPTIPRQFVFRNLEARAMKELGRPLSDYNYRTSVGVPSQLVDEKLLRSWDELGFLKPKTGGVNNPE